MKRDQLQATLGFYRPSFFRMQLNVTQDLSNPNVLSDTVSSLYLHEYIHFLQDITTTYGLSNILMVVDNIAYVNEIVIADKSATFNVPFKVKPSQYNNVWFNAKLKEKYLGSYDNVDAASNINIVKHPTIVTLKNGTENIDIILIEYTDKGGYKKQYEFGSIAIMESMAYIIENSIYPGLIHPTPDLPYRSAELLIQKEYAILNTNPLNVLALCDCSLKTFNPAESFFVVLEKMRSNNYIPSSPEDVYVFFENNLPPFNFSNNTTLDNLLKYTSNVAMTQLCNYFTTNIFKDNKDWIKYTIDSAVSLRLRNPHFMLDIARNGRIQANNIFIKLFTILGTPMIFNISGDGYFYSPLQTTKNIVPEYLSAINQVYILYFNAVKKCELKIWCKKSCGDLNVPDFTDSKCDIEPWNRLTGYKDICAFAQIWKTWALKGKIPQ